MLVYVSNYVIQCRDAISGKIGCFFYDQEHWQRTGEFRATSEVYPNLPAFYANTNQADRQSAYLERDDCRND